MSTSSVRTDPLTLGNEDARRSSYTTPQLTRLGSVRDLTDSGSGLTVENNQGGGQPSRRP